MKYTNKNVFNKMTSARGSAVKKKKNSKYIYRVFQILCPVMKVVCVVNLIVCLCVTGKEAHILYTFIVEFW